MTGMRSLPVSAWPPADAAAWEAVCNPRPGPFRKTRQLSPYTYRKLRLGLGTFYWYLQTIDQLLPGETPTERPTPERLDGFYERLTESGNADHTIVDRFRELRGAMQLLEPAGDFAFITMPGGVSLRSLLPMRRRVRFVPDSRHAVLWAESLFKKGLELPFAAHRRRLVRDAAMLGIFASRAPRVGSMVRMRLGKHLTRTTAGWELFFDRPLMKGGRKTLELPIGSRVSAMLERYVTVERPELLGERKHDFLWVSRSGAPLSYSSILGMVRLRTKAHFGVAFGPHRFRHSLTTTQAVIDGTDPLGPSLILGHSPEVNLENYNRATALERSRRHDARIELAEDAAARLLRSHGAD